jgi:hypothetical protein
MAELDRTPRQRHPRSVPAGLLEELRAEATTANQAIRDGEVARARQHAADRAYDDGAVVEEIAEQLLSLSAS